MSVEAAILVIAGGYALGSIVGVVLNIWDALKPDFWAWQHPDEMAAIERSRLEYYIDKARGAINE